MMQCGMEVVLPNGEVVRTGMGAMPGNNTWQLFKYGFGPYVDGMFSQSNFGIVTKMGIWLMPEPPGYRPYMITFQREEDIEQVVEIVRPLQARHVIQNAATIRSLVLDAAIIVDQEPVLLRHGPDPGQRRAARSWPTRKSACGISAARCTGRRRSRMRCGRSIRDSFAKIPGAKFYFPEDRKRRPTS